MMGLVVFVALVLVGALFDPIGWGYLLSSKVDAVADVRLAEPIHGIPLVYFIASTAPGAGAIISMTNVPMLERAATGIALTMFLLVTMWDMRRRRGTLAVYIRLRREELSFHPLGDVIEVPKLMFGVMNEPGPVVWLLGALAAVVIAIAEFEIEVWLGSLPPVLIAVAAVYVWFRRRGSAWEPLAKRLRAASFLDGEKLADHLQEALDVDPEVIIVRREADAMVARVVSGS
jgi:hypothetical protein